MARSDSDPNRVAIIGLSARFHRPIPASPRVRDAVPDGYGVREQCLPFIAAAGLGFTVPSPFSWGFCAPGNTPANARKFRSPIPGGCPERVFYVLDDPAIDFGRNEFRLTKDALSRTGPLRVPGLSFFDRSDQQDLVKVHLPYVWSTESGIELLFLPPINRPRTDGLFPLAGLVESSWYLNPINLVMQLPASPTEIHVEGGEAIAQVVVLDHSLRSARLDLPAGHKRQARDVHQRVGELQSALDQDRSAYKRIAKSKAALDPVTDQDQFGKA